MNLFPRDIPLKSNVTQFNKKTLSINTIFYLSPTQAKTQSTKNLRDVSVEIFKGCFTTFIFSRSLQNFAQLY